MLEYRNIEIKKLASKFFQNPDQGMHLFDRDLGQQIRQQIEDIIANYKKEEIVFYLDFKDVLSIDFSCADELIGKLTSRLLSDEYGEIFIVLQNLNDNQLENIQVALDRRKVACLRRCSDQDWQLLGYKKNYLVETLDVVVKRGKITARELSHELDLELTTSSTRLSHLHKAHLVFREQVIVDGGGREFLYINCSLANFKFFDKNMT